MTRINIYRNKHENYTGFTAIGHADFKDAGEDIVCAALSILIQNTINSIEAFTNLEASLVTNEEEGLIDYRLKNYSDKSQLLMSSLVLGIRNLSEDESYGDYIQLVIEEV